MDNKLILAIETSCDETAAAVVGDAGGRPRIISNVVATQHEFHARFGGIVPEIAARRHAEVLEAVIAEALSRAGIGFADLGAVAVVHGPGLIGSLVVSVAAAKAIALARNLPLVGVNHLEGHLYASFLPQNEGDEAPAQEPQLPLLVLIASGGHTHLVVMRGHGQFEVVGRTRDDAAGEAFDKAGKLLDLGYPGGPAVAKLAEAGRERAVDFPVAEVGGWDFSFSGTKTALARQVKELGPEGLEKARADLAASFQWAIVRALVETTLRAAEQIEVADLALAGGVAANLRLREELAQRAARLGLRLHVPPVWLCTDNAAMIGAAAYYKLRTGKTVGLNLDCDAGLNLANW
jgi:N6-L-threonylcarbamoyladenine synthase